MLNAPRKTLESVIKASRGFRSDLTARGAGFNSWRGEKLSAGEAINSDYLKSFCFFSLSFLFSGGIFHGGVTSGRRAFVRMKDDRALGPIGLDYRITGLIIGQSSGKSRSRAIDASWMTGTRKGWINKAAGSCFFFSSSSTFGGMGRLRVPSEQSPCNSVPHRGKK